MTPPITAPDATTWRPSQRGVALLAELLRAVRERRAASNDRAESPAPQVAGEKAVAP